MEAYERRIIFSQKFPDAYPMAILEKMEEISRADPAARKEPPIPFKDLLKQFEEEETYEPRPGGEKTSVIFVSLAKSVCMDFEIDTEITKRKHAIDVTMDLGYGWYSADVKRALTAVLKLADEFNLTCNQSRPDCVRVSMTYNTHIRYVRGKRMDW